MSIFVSKREQQNFVESECFRARGSCVIKRILYPLMAGMAIVHTGEEASKELIYPSASVFTNTK